MTYAITVARTGPGTDIALAVDGTPIAGSVVAVPQDGRKEVAVTATIG